MGMYCCCDRKIHRDGEWECHCDWDGWISLADFPSERKNKHLPLSYPIHDGKYLVRRLDHSADRYEEEAEFFLKGIVVECGYTGKPHEINWSGDPDHQPYAWKEM